MLVFGMGSVAQRAQAVERRRERADEVRVGSSSDERRLFQLKAQLPSERLRPAADALPRSVEQVEPPPALKASLMEVVDREARERSGAPAARQRRAWPIRLPSLAGIRLMSPRQRAI